MSPLLFLLIAVVLSALGCGVLYLRHRSPTTYDSGIREFRREMDALAPPTASAEGDPHRWRKGRR
jgi:hypothetical protein